MVWSVEHSMDQMNVIIRLLERFGYIRNAALKNDAFSKQ